jgi:DNA-binding CsgD family transcriptional regulator
MNLASKKWNKAVLELFAPGLTVASYPLRCSRFAHRLIGCDLTAFAGFTPSTGELTVEFDGRTPGMMKCVEGFVNYISKYPFTDFDPRSTGWKPFVREEFVTYRQFREMDIYRDGLRHAGISDHSAIPIRTSEGKILYLGVERCDGGVFREDEVEMLKLMQPHLENARALALVREAVSPDAVEPEDFKGAGLTPRESEVLYWIAQGKTNAEISLVLGLKVSTVKSYVFELFNKLGVSNRHAAILRGLELAQQQQLEGGSPASGFTRVTATAPGRRKAGTLPKENPQP